ncbi:MAG: dihydrofolate reductase [Saprospiraceae bacterium]|nr:dihydrofolate reductase [Saprospiraceae bacterium]
MISAIVAYDKNRVIGKDGDIPWYLPDDFKYFKKTTLNHHIIMGRKCFESIGRPLPKRTNIILTRNPFYLVSNCLVVPNLEEALQIARDNEDEEAFICGGGQIYELSLPITDRLYITEIDLEVEGKPEEFIYFPEVDFSEWELTWEEHHPTDDRHPYAFTFKQFSKKAATVDLPKPL